MSESGAGRATHVRPHHRMVDRVATIVETVARSEGMSLTEIAHQVQAPVSSVQGLVNGLVATGYLDERARTYRLGVTPYFLNLLAGRVVTTRVEHQDLVDLREDLGGSAGVVLAVPIGADIAYLDHSSTEPRTAYLAERFLRRSMIRATTGWVLLASWQERDLWAYLDSLGHEDDQRVEGLLAALPGIREHDVAVLPGAAEGGEVDGIAVPVREGGRVVASVGVVMRRGDLVPRRDEVVESLQRHAKSWHAKP